MHALLYFLAEESCRMITNFLIQWCQEYHFQKKYYITLSFFFNVFNTLYKTKHFRQRGSTADALMLTKQTFIGVSF